MSRVYLSNIAPGWPIERQEAVLDAKLPGWRTMAIFRDADVTVRQRRERDPDSLGGRIAALRPSSRSRPTNLYAAALPVMAWGVDDFRDNVLPGLSAGNYYLVIPETGTHIEPRPSKAIRDAAVEEFKATRKRAADEATRLKGSAVSAVKRRAATDAAIERIRPHWGAPASEWPTKALLETAGGISYNTAVSRLGGRETAQRRYQAELKRKVKREQRQAT